MIRSSFPLDHKITANVQAHQWRWIHALVGSHSDADITSGKDKTLQALKVVKTGEPYLDW